MADQYQITDLAKDLRDLREPGPGQCMSHGIAQAILNKPQAAVDLLVKAGVLEPRSGMGWSPSTYYQVIVPKPPHEHTWKVSHRVGNQVRLICNDCAATKLVPNRLPMSLD